MSSYPNIGQSINIISYKSNGTEIRYISMIEDIERDGKISIAVPIKKGRYVSFLKGTELTISYGLDNR